MTAELVLLPTYNIKTDEDIQSVNRDDEIAELN